MGILQPKLQKLQDEIKSSPDAYDPAKMTEFRARAQALFKEHKVRPFMSFLMPISQLPIFLGFFWGLQDIAKYIPGYAADGAFWFENLAAPDPTYALPVLSSALMVASLEVCIFVCKLLIFDEYSVVSDTMTLAAVHIQRMARGKLAGKRIRLARIVALMKMSKEMFRHKLQVCLVKREWNEFDHAPDTTPIEQLEDEMKTIVWEVTRLVRDLSLDWWKLGLSEERARLTWEVNDAKDDLRLLQQHTSVLVQNCTLCMNLTDPTLQKQPTYLQALAKLAQVQNNELLPTTRLELPEDNPATDTTPSLPPQSYSVEPTVDISSTAISPIEAIATTLPTATDSTKIAKRTLHRSPKSKTPATTAVPGLKDMPRLLAAEFKLIGKSQAYKGKVMGVAQLKLLLHEVYGARMADELRAPVGEFLYRFFALKYGLRNVAEMYLVNFVTSLKKYWKADPEKEGLSRKSYVSQRRDAITSPIDMNFLETIVVTIVVVIATYFTKTGLFATDTTTANGPNAASNNTTKPTSVNGTVVCNTRGMYLDNNKCRAFGFDGIDIDDESGNLMTGGDWKANAGSHVESYLLAIRKSLDAVERKPNERAYGLTWDEFPTSLDVSCNNPKGDYQRCYHPAIGQVVDQVNLMMYNVELGVCISEYDVLLKSTIPSVWAAAVPPSKIVLGGCVGKPGDEGACAFGASPTIPQLQQYASDGYTKYGGTMLWTGSADYELNRGTTIETMGKPSGYGAQAALGQ
ncbi:hypothetical protein DYB37_007731 [Aphanomyces astaci]|uniref:Membrane insertase YidC/Oxa/ALB C-terminal domain-containing protein n=1 Tax=Aphanomyces astaci TaxID=112090 RepID=A0A418FCH8_APHAT|nr:hypothetical protein DYB37_007731 [Aphanomyces astaci]